LAEGTAMKKLLILAILLLGMFGGGCGREEDPDAWACSGGITGTVAIPAQNPSSAQGGGGAHPAAKVRRDSGDLC
jgi:hypothetical protein